MTTWSNTVTLTQILQSSYNTFILLVFDFHSFLQPIINECSHISIHIKLVEHTIVFKLILVLKQNYWRSSGNTLHSFYI